MGTTVSEGLDFPGKMARWQGQGSTPAFFCCQREKLGVCLRNVGKQQAG
jgi:hypothetical protein